MMTEISQLDSNSRFNISTNSNTHHFGLEILNLTPTEIEMSDMADQICQENLRNFGVTTQYETFSLSHSGLKMGKIVQK